jgi:hypothetical protein
MAYIQSSTNTLSLFDSGGSQHHMFSSPSPTSAPNSHVINVHQPEVNTYGFDNNCYCTTLAGLLNTTVEDLFKECERMQ